MAEEKTRLVYSTDKAIPRKEKSAAEKQPPAHPSGQPRVRLDRKGRAGKSVTIIEGLRILPPEREGLLRRLKTKLGTGGTDRAGTFEIQGDHRDAVISLLQEMGHKPKRSGG